MSMCWSTMSFFTAFVYEAWRRANICWSSWSQVLWAHQVFWGQITHFHSSNIHDIWFVCAIYQIWTKLYSFICYSQLFCRQLKECQRLGLDTTLLPGCLTLLLQLKRTVLVWTLLKYTEDQIYISTFSSQNILVLIKFDGALFLLSCFLVHEILISFVSDVIRSWLKI